MSTSLTVRCDDATAVVEAARSLSRRCFVGPVEDGWVGVFDEASDQDDRECVRFGKALTKRLRRDALAAMVHDGDTFACWIFSRGRLLDTYESWPAYFDGGPPAPRGGDPALLCKIAGAPEAELAVRRILRRGVATKGKRAPSLHDDMALHEGLWSALGLPLSTVGLGYKYLGWGDRPKAADGRSDLDVIYVDGGGGAESSRRSTRSKEPAALGAEMFLASLDPAAAREHISAMIANTVAALDAAVHVGAQQRRKVERTARQSLAVYAAMRSRCPPASCFALEALIVRIQELGPGG